MIQTRWHEFTHANAFLVKGNNAGSNQSFRYGRRTHVILWYFVRAVLLMPFAIGPCRSSCCRDTSLLAHISYMSTCCLSVLSSPKEWAMSTSHKTYRVMPCCSESWHQRMKQEKGKNMIAGVERALFHTKQTKFYPPAWLAWGVGSVDSIFAKAPKLPS